MRPRTVACTCADAAPCTACRRRASYRKAKKTPRSCAGCGRVIAYRGSYYCDACRPARRCVHCHGAIEAERARNATSCLRCAQARQRVRHGSLPAPSCAICQTAIVGRGSRAIYCARCAEAEAIRQNRESAARMRRPLSEAPRDLELEARIDAYARAIRASGRYHIEDIIWSRRSDPVSANAPEAL